MRHTSTGSFELPIPARQAISLFTPEGERDWVPGWDPVYPDGAASSTAGTVFTTDAHGTHTIWTIIEIDPEEHRSAYARITAGRHAGTVRVVCEGAGDDRCRVNVSYDMTLLEGADSALLEPYEPAHIDAMLRHWQELTSAWLGSDRAGAAPTT